MSIGERIKECRRYQDEIRQLQEQLEQRFRETGAVDAELQGRLDALTGEAAQAGCLEEGDGDV